LVRARFSAFALRDTDYLWKTLHSRHEDRQRLAQDGAEAFRQELLAGTRSLKFVRLHILEVLEAEVVFVAEVFEAGRERSFLERATFELESGEWRYLRGASRSCHAQEILRERAPLF
jgi:SEC-C motif-containing protein